jgi:hypothetical protein
MASSHVAGPIAGRRRTLTRACAVVGTVIVAAGLPIAVGPAASMAASSARTQTRSPRLELSVTSVSPSYATPHHAIKLKGRVWNGGHSSITGLSVQLYSSTAPFNSEIGLEGFAANTIPVGESQVTGATHQIGKLPGRHGVGWSIDLPVSALRLNCFGVYPLTVKVTDPTGTLTASDPVPLPFWPTKPNSCSSAIRPAPFAISWIWPLIDSPHQGACPGLLDNSLASSLAPGGRLADLVSVGASYAAKARLTWAIDPALLDSARTMTQSYQVGGSASCADQTVHAPDQNARTWLSEVVSATAGHPVFVTPYADVDVAGLAQYLDNSDADLKNAFTDGEQLAGPILRRSPVPAALPAAPKRLSAIAWPSGGLPSPIVLENLGAMKIRTFILAMPPPQGPHTPGAVTGTIDGLGDRLRVLLGDYSLSKILASSAANSRQPGTIFNVSQLFLAETAMIVAEAPALSRPMVVTPPRRWDPASTLASDLLGDTVTAPWLRSMNVNQLATTQREQPYPSSLVRPGARAELPGKLLRKLNKLDHSVTLLQSIMPTKDNRLSRAVYGIESAAWAGAGATEAQALLDNTSQYVRSQFGGLSVGGQRVINVTLGGRVGSVTVSIRNALSYPVRVRLQVTSSNNTVAATQRHKFYEVAPHSSSGLKLKVNATQTGKAKVTVSLESPTGVLLPNPPDKPLIMKISATNLGTVALIIFAAALAVFVIASAAQAIRRGRPGGSQSPEADDPASDGGPSHEAGAFETRRDEKDEAETERSAAEPADAGLWLPAEDERDPRARPDRTDNVFGERSELSSVGRRPTEERR